MDSLSGCTSRSPQAPQSPRCQRSAEARGGRTRGRPVTQELVTRLSRDPAHNPPFALPRAAAAKRSAHAPPGATSDATTVPSAGTAPAGSSGRSGQGAAASVPPGFPHPAAPHLSRGPGLNVPPPAPRHRTHLRPRRPASPRRARGQARAPLRKSDPPLTGIPSYAPSGDGAARGPQVRTTPAGPGRLPWPTPRTGTRKGVVKPALSANRSKGAGEISTPTGNSSANGKRQWKGAASKARPSL